MRAFAGDQRLVPGQEAGTDKANELPASPLRLERRGLAGQVVTIDAMGCQRSRAEQIVGQGGDDVLADTPPTLLEAVIDCFTMADRVADPALAARAYR